MSQHLHHKLAGIHESLLHGKLPRSLHWSDVIDLIGHLGQVQHGGDEFAFLLGTQREVFKRPQTPSSASMRCRDSGNCLKKPDLYRPPTKFVQPCRMIVVIDHHSAHIFRDFGETRPRNAATTKPYDPHHFHHHLVHRKEAHYKVAAYRKRVSFYEEVAAALVSAKEIVLIGHGTGKSSAAHF